MPWIEEGPHEVGVADELEGDLHACLRCGRRPVLDVLAPLIEATEPSPARPAGTLGRQ